MNKGKTIKQIADEIGVSKQAVEKRIRREPLKSSIYASIDKVGGVVYIAYMGEKLIKQAFFGNDYIQSTDKPYTNHIRVDDNAYIPENQLYDILKQEIDAKNKQIKDLQLELSKEREYSREQTNQIAVFADQSQKLQLAQIQVQLIEGDKPSGGISMSENWEKRLYEAEKVFKEGYKYSVVLPKLEKSFTGKFYYKMPKDDMDNLIKTINELYSFKVAYETLVKNE